MAVRATFNSTSTALVSGHTIAMPAVAAGDRINFVVALGTNDRTVTATIGGTSISQIANSPAMGSGARARSDVGSWVFDYVAPSAISAGTNLVVSHATLSGGGAAATARSSVVGIVHAGYGTGWTTTYVSSSATNSSGTDPETNARESPAINSVTEGTIELAIITDAETDLASTYGTSAWTVKGNVDLAVANYNTTANAPQISAVIGTKYVGTPFGASQIGERRWTATNDNTGVPTTMWTIGFKPANIPPSANAGVDQSVNPGDTVTLTGTATDTDGTISSYSWAQSNGPAVTLAGSGATRTFTAPGIENGTVLGFTLTVTDNLGATSTDSMAVVVAPATEFHLNSSGEWRGIVTAEL